MEKREDLLIIEPANELRFRDVVEYTSKCFRGHVPMSMRHRPFTKPCITVMKLTNPTKHTVLFKIKTTAPKKYCVRPNFGSVAPGSNTKVEICLQAFNYDANEKNKHKFMVQSLIAPDDTTDYAYVWRDAEPDDLRDAKLKCVFEMPAEAADADTTAPKQASKVTNETAPAPAGDEKPTDSQQEKLLEEIRTLKDESCDLREENLSLKNQIMRLKYTSSQRLEGAYSPTVERQIPMVYIAICIITAIFGIFLGKYLL